jgi:hypothetical protein
MTSPHSAAKVKPAIAGSTKVRTTTVASTAQNLVTSDSIKPKVTTAGSARVKPHPITAVARHTAVTVPDPVFDPQATNSGAINEKQLVAVLTEMCRFVLAAQRNQTIGAATN